MRDVSQVHGGKSKLKRNIMKVKMTDMERRQMQTDWTAQIPG